MSVISTGPGPTDATDKGLESGALGLLSNVVIGVASTAPAHGLAATAAAACGCPTRRSRW